MVDRVTSMEVGSTIEGIKCWSITDEYFNEHFPGFPVVPGVLVTESMAQLLGTLVEKSYDEKFPDTDGIYAVLTIVHKAKFKKFLIPGDQAIMKAKLNSLDKHSGSGTVKVYVDDKLCSSAELSFGLVPRTELPNPKLAEIREEYFNILFNAKRVRDQLGDRKLNRE